MGIYTRFGSKVQIVSCVKDKRDIEWVTIRREDGSESETTIDNLKADGGIVEIDQAIRLAMKGV